jgi:peptidoglycan pentaglycine glycine transferase (the first glycine)
MAYEYRLLTEEEEIHWEKIVLSEHPNLFVRSALYGKFFQRRGDDYRLIGIFENKVLIGGCLFIKVNAKRGKYLYAPYGPILDYKEKALFRDFVAFTKTFAKEEKVDFVKLSPFLDDREEYRKLFREAGLRLSPLHVLAETTWILDITPTEEKLMLGMRQTTRNLIRRAEKDGVVVEGSDQEEALEGFFPIFNETAKRHHFTAYSEDYIREEFRTFAEYDLVRVYNAYYNGEVLSSAIVYFYGDTAVYRHGASTHKHAKIPTSYAIQWRAIQDAKDRGCTQYNFWGIAPSEKETKHPFYGITRFKKGFGGEQKDILHCHDLPITWKYWMNYGVEQVRKWRRGF